MEAINDSSKLVAQAINRLKAIHHLHECITYNREAEISEVIKLLEDVLIKLTNKL